MKGLGYKLVRGTGSETEAEVDDLIKRGWHLVGELQVIWHAPSMQFVFIQPMILVEQYEPEEVPSYGGSD